MSETNPDPQTVGAKAPKTKTTFVFVDNAGERIVGLTRVTNRNTPKGTAHETQSTTLGRGLNYVRAEYVTENGEDGLRMLGLKLSDPTKIHELEVPAAIQRCTSRQALIEWSKIEKRPAVVDKIKARLDGRGPQPEADDEAAA